MIEKLDGIKQEWIDMDLTYKLVEFTDKINELIEAVNKLKDQAPK